MNPESLAGGRHKVLLHSSTRAQDQDSRQMGFPEGLKEEDTNAVPLSSISAENLKFFLMSRIKSAP